MTSSSKGIRATNSLIRSSRYRCICPNCISFSTRLQKQRQYATEAVASKPSFEAPSISRTPPVTSGDSHFVVKSGVLLSRPPLLTRPLSSFENAFYFYQKRLNERLAMPFTRYFYFKKDTPADNDWKRKAIERNGSAARELGGYQAYGKHGWNDEVLVGDKVSEPSVMVEALVKDAVMIVEEEGGVEKDAAAIEQSIERPLERISGADKSGDLRRLDREIARTLYLCVRGDKGGWRFPSGTLVGRENLHQAAERILVQTGGVNMNTWIVGHVPVGYHTFKPHYAPNSSLIKPGEKTFFMKGRIMAGQADLRANLFGLTDFKWLTKEEVKKHFAAGYFNDVEKMMGDR